MLPTPHKTPRKRSQEGEETLGSTARVLFSNRPTRIEDAMPTPRRGRKSNPFSLMEEEGDGEIPIYTDSKERIPTEDEEEDNPFITKRGRGKRTRAPVKATVDPKMQEAADKGEGIIYMLYVSLVLLYCCTANYS